MNFENVKKVKRSKPFTVVDAVIVAVLIAAIAVAFLATTRIPSDVVTITTPNGKYEYDINIDRAIELEHLTVHIQNGAVWVVGADCGDKTCERTGRINRAGQSIVCLPNGISVVIGGSGDLQWELGR